MSSFFEEKELRESTTEFLFEQYGKMAARRELLKIRIERVKNNFLERPSRFTDEEFFGSEIEELIAEEQKYFQRILQIDSELRRRRTQ